MPRYTVVALLLCACSAPLPEQSLRSSCTPGASVSCVCPDTTAGAQTCKADGTFDVCQCRGGKPTEMDTPPAAKPVVPAQVTDEDAAVPVDAGAPVVDAALSDAGVDAFVPADTGAPDVAVDSSVPPPDAAPPVDAGPTSNITCAATVVWVSTAYPVCASVSIPTYTVIQNNVPASEHPASLTPRYVTLSIDAFQHIPGMDPYPFYETAKNSDIFKGYDPTKQTVTTTPASPTMDLATADVTITKWATVSLCQLTTVVCTGSALTPNVPNL